MAAVRNVFVLVALIFTVCSCQADDLSMEYLAERINALEKQGILQTELLQSQNLELTLLRSVVNDSKSRLQRQEQLITEYMKRVKELEQDGAKNHADIIQRMSELIVDAGGKEKDALVFSSSLGEGLVSNLNSPNTKEWTIKDPSTICTYAAFHAVLAAESASGIGVNNTVIFPVVISNMCGGYNETDGIFTAPIEGVYVFSVSIATKHSSGSNVYITIEGKPIAGAFGDAGGNYEQGSVTAVIQLAAKEKVWVAMTTDHIQTLYGYGYTSFTGFLVAP